MIPNKIHYCWFGRRPLPESAKRCIASWRRFLPGYEIIEWNEDNFDVNAIPYTAEAYSAGKYAFVSDYARFRILYDQGGIYFDTDVEVIRPMDAVIASGPFLGFEINPCKEWPDGAVAPGLGMGAVPAMPFYKKVLDYYGGAHFILPDGTQNTAFAVVGITTAELIRAGLSSVQGVQHVAGIDIYPADYFNPLEDATGHLRKTPNTLTIHWFTKSWMSISPTRQRLSRLYHRLFGTALSPILRKLIR